MRSISENKEEFQSKDPFTDEQTQFKEADLSAQIEIGDKQKEGKETAHEMVRSELKIR